jgi:hypothetical protein
MFEPAAADFWPSTADPLSTKAFFSPKFVFLMKLSIVNKINIRENQQADQFRRTLIPIHCEKDPS